MDYGHALEVMDLVRGGGVETLAVLADESVPTLTAQSGSASGSAGSR